MSLSSVISSGHMALREAQKAAVSNIVNFESLAHQAVMVDLSADRYTHISDAMIVQTAKGTQYKTPLYTPGGVTINGSYRNLSAGPMEHTNLPMDIAIKGAGYYAVQVNGSTALYRGGKFHLDAERRIVDSSGNPLLSSYDGDAITVPENVDISDTNNFVVSQDGSILVKTSGSTERESIGNIQLVTVANEQALMPDGQYYYVNDAVGATSSLTPGSDGSGTLIQGYTQKSNVDMISEMQKFNTYILIQQALISIDKASRAVSDSMIDSLSG